MFNMNVESLAKWLEMKYNEGHRFYRVVEQTYSMDNKLCGYDVESSRNPKDFPKIKNYYKQTFPCSEFTNNFTVLSKNIITFIKKQKLQEDF